MTWKVWREKEESLTLALVRPCASFHAREGQCGAGRIGIEQPDEPGLDAGVISTRSKLIMVGEMRKIGVSGNAETSDRRDLNCVSFGATTDESILSLLFTTSPPAYAPS